MDIEKIAKETIKEYKLCNKNEKIIVAISGGKDSTIVAYLLKKFGFEIEGLYIDLGIEPSRQKYLDSIKKLSEVLGIKIHVYNIKKEFGKSIGQIIEDVRMTKEGKNLKNCAICGVVKKWIINKEARKLHGNKIATGHNLDDEIETFLINILKGSPKLSSNSGPITRNKGDKKFIPRIKPLFYCDEEEIRNYCKKLNLPAIYEKCPYLIDSYRLEVRNFVKTLSTKEKNNIMNNYQFIYPKIKKLSDNSKKEKINYCIICGEPSKGELCKTCQLIRNKK